MPSHLDSVTDFPSLLTYLEEELDWPIDAASFEEATFNYKPSELGLKEEAVGGAIEIKQLRPLVDNQPWGVFFLNLPQKRLSKTIVRNILGKLTVKKRSAANDPGRVRFTKSDLLFIASTGAGEDRRLAFAHFKDDVAGGNAATLELLGWDGDDTPRRYALTERMLAGQLHWPEDTADTEAWRQQWSGAFSHAATPTVVRDVRAMAKALAALARRIRDRAGELIAAQTVDGSMVQLHAAFKEALLHDLTPDGFADTYAQTIAYGLLSTAISRNSGALAQDDLPRTVAGTSPFLKEMLATFLEAGGRRGGQDGDGLNFDELGVAEIVELLRNGADMEAVLADFDRRNPDEDPVIHFYELFLKEYDPVAKVKRGVFYTPRPVVGFIVRSVDEVLRTEFGLADGLASTTTWAELIASKPGIKLPTDAKAEDPFVRILDPATGTGTFLVECVDLIHKTMLAKWRAAGKRDAEIKALWNEYVPKHLLPRLTGFELMMAPYAIAHVKLGLKLSDTGYTFGSEARSQIYLTNALEPAHELNAQMSMAFITEALAHEAKAANEAKASGGFTVVLGNPPYAGKSSNRGAWIESLVDEYRAVDGRALNEVKVWLRDDYVKFTAFAQSTVRRCGVGVVGLITNNSYFDGLTHRGMRKSLIDTFKSTWIVNLHGNSNLKEITPQGDPDENVFDIRQGVGVIVACTLGTTRGYLDLWGTRNNKAKMLARLILADVASAGRSDLSPLNYFLTSYDRSNASEYAHYLPLTDLFEVSGLGFQSHRDHFVIAIDRNQLVDRVRDYLDLNNSDEEVRSRYNLSDYERYSVGGFRRDNAFDAADIVETDYRPFDVRYVYYRDQIVQRRLIAVHGNMLHENIGLNLVRQTKAKRWQHAMVARRPTPAVFLEIKDGSSQFPLYAFSDIAKKVARRANLKARLLHPSAPPEAVFAYIYALLWSPSYASRYQNELKIAFPRIPPARHEGAFQALVPLGNELVALHLLDVTAASLLADPKSIRLAGAGDNRITRKAADFESSAWSGGRMYISASQWFEDVPERVADFYIGGYRPARRWLKDRATKSGVNPRDGLVLTAEDILHYRRMIVAIDRSIELMAKIDRIIDEHGGWPGAFRGMSDGA